MVRVAIIAVIVLLSMSGGVGHAEPADAGVGPSDTAYTPRPSAQSGAKRDIRIEGGKSSRVTRVAITGTVDLGLAAFVARALDQSRDGAAVLLEINTLGGRVDAAIEIRDALLESHRKIIAFVHPRAISAGALIALAADVIAISPGASMGAATPIQLGNEGAEAVSEKMVSYFRSELRSTAEAKGRRGDIAEAMVDRSVVIPGLDTADKLLTLDTDGALETGMADLRASDVAAVLAGVGLADAEVVTLHENWAERLVRFVTDPVVTGLLMSLGTLGILIELYTPGVGLPGALGVLCLSLFFGGHLIVNLAGLEELLLLGLGFSLLALELFVIPGFGVAGVLGLLCVVGALALSLVALPLDVLLSTGAWVEPLTRVALALLLTFVGLAIAVRFLPRTRAMRRLVLAYKLDSQTGAKGGPEGFVSADESSLLGAEGTAESDLRPVGVARFGDRRVDVISEGGYVRTGTRVRVCEVEGSRVVVKAEGAEQIEV